MGLQNSDGALYWATGIDTTGLSQGRQQSVGILRGLSSQVSKMDVFAGLALSGGIAFKRLAIQAKNFSEEFEQSMREVLTISAALQGDFEGYSDMIVDMSRELPQSANALAKAYYQIVSAGYDGAAGLELLNQASRAAVGGVTDVTTAADGMTTVLNAWNLSAEQSAAVSDTFFTAVRLGKTTFGEMAASISQAAPLASAYGVSFNEIAAAIASITKQGTTTPVALTQIRAALIAVNEELGQGWSDAMSFQDAMQEIADRAQASGKDLKEFTGRVEGALAILQTTGKNAKGAAEDLQAIADSAGAADKAYSQMAQSSINQSKIMKNNIDAALKPLGDWVANKSTGFARAMNDAFATGQVEKYVEFIKIATVSLAAYALTANGAALSTQIMRKAINLAALSMNKLRIAFASNPIGLVVLGLTAAVTAFTAYNKKVDQSTRVSARLVESISSDIFSLNALFNKLKTAEKGTEDWNQARELINTRYGSYLKNLIDEKTALEDIEAAQKRVTEAMMANAGLKVYREQLSSELDKYSREFEKKMGDFTQVFTKMKGADRLPEFIGAINDAIDKEIVAGNGKIKRGMLERSQIAMDVYNEFLYDISQQTGFVKYDPKAFTEAFLDIAELKAEGKPYTDYLQGMVETWSGMLSEFNKKSSGSGAEGGPGGEGGSEILNYYESLLKKISETEDQLKDLSGTQGEMDLIAIAAKKELLQQYSAELQALELLLGLKEKEKQVAENQGSQGSILGIRQQIEALNQQYIEATTDTARESLRVQIESKEKELEAIQGVIQEQVKLYEDYYKTIERKSITWLQGELTRLKAVGDAKRKAFSEGGDLSDEEKKGIIEDLNEIDGKIKSIEGEIRNDLTDAVQLASDVFSALSSIVGDIDQKAGRAVASMGRAISGIGQIAIGTTTGNPLAVVSGVLQTTVAVIGLFSDLKRESDQYIRQLEKINDLLSAQDRILDQAPRKGNMSDEYKKQIELLKIKIAMLIELLKLEMSPGPRGSSYSGDLSLEERKQREQELADTKATLADLEQTYSDFLSGGITEFNLADKIAQAFEEGKTSVKDFASYAEEVLGQAVLSVFKEKILGEFLTKAFDSLGTALEDDELTQSEVDKFTRLFSEGAEGAGAIWEQLTQALPGFFGSASENANSLSGAIRRNITEETGSILAGSMSALRLDVREMNGYQLEMVGHLERIADNTKHNKHLEIISQKMNDLLLMFQNNA